MKRVSYNFNLLEVIAAGLLALGVMLSCLSTQAAGDEVLYEVCHNDTIILVANPAVLQGHLNHGDFLSCEGRCCYMAEGKYVTDNVTREECAVIEGSTYNPNPDTPCFEGGD